MRLVRAEQEQQRRDEACERCGTRAQHSGEQEAQRDAECGMDREREEDRSAKPDRSAEQMPVHATLLRALYDEEHGDLHEKYSREQVPECAVVECRRRCRPGRAMRCREGATDANDDPDGGSERRGEEGWHDVERAVVSIVMMPEQPEVRRCLDDRIRNRSGQERSREAEAQPDGRPRHARLASRIVARLLPP